MYNGIRPTIYYIIPDVRTMNAIVTLKVTIIKRICNTKPHIYTMYYILKILHTNSIYGTFQTFLGLAERICSSPRRDGKQFNVGDLFRKLCSRIGSTHSTTKPRDERREHHFSLKNWPETIWDPEGEKKNKRSRHEENK